MAFVPRCPTCGKRFALETSTAMPFCSDRCRQIDLGRWLSEEQRLPVNALDEAEPPDEPDQADDDD